MPHNILILGSGGREHAIGWKLKQSKEVGKIFFAPGNGGTAEVGTNVSTLPYEPVTTKAADDILRFVRDNKIDLVVIGPEDPLSEGLADRLAASPHAPKWIFGPKKNGAQLEGDKAFAKDLMRACQIPTADARTFTHFEAAVEYVKSRETPLVIKAAGLCKGKGVVLPDTQEEAVKALHDIMVKKVFGDAGSKVLVEERLVGQEASLLCFVDGTHIFPMEAAQDHKRAFDGDKGPNTGGMGVYAPTPVLTDALLAQVERDILVPTLDAMRRHGIDFKGILFVGLMLTQGGPKVLEYNCRFGDPETQTLLIKMKGDLFKAMVACCEGKLDEVDFGFEKTTSVCVVMASGGYPGDYKKGLPITGIADAEKEFGVKVFHAGTKLDKEGRTVTAGGRVLNVCATGKTVAEARAKANAACEKIKFEGGFFRRDIGWRAG